MGKQFKLKKLSLIGTRKNYEVIFKDGLNYISGPTSTGKTSILEMINYALGSEKHKNYIEIGQSCIAVELEIEIKDCKYKIRRKLFEFNEPVAVFAWNSQSNTFELLDTYEIDIPSNPKSLSAFLLEKLDLSNIKVAKQEFSFRDLFKFSYLKQTEIDNENIMGEKNWQTSIKRKPTFEIIFNMYDKLVAELKTSLKVKNKELRELQIKNKGISEFLERIDVVDLKTYFKKRQYAESNILEKQKQLEDIKRTNNTNDEISLSLQKRIVNLKNSIEKIEKDISDQKQYLNKLQMLKNQYISEVHKIDFIIEGYKTLDKYDYILCPSCLQPINKNDDLHTCSLCGREKTELKIDEILQFKQDKKRFIKKHKELVEFIKREEKNLQILIKKNSGFKADLLNLEKELLYLQKDYVNPYIEQIEQLNYEIGELNRALRELDNDHNLFIELDRINKLYDSKQQSIKDLNEKIKNTENSSVNRDELIKDLSGLLSGILDAFAFPKLENAYIDEKTYLPYVRGRLYRDLGSLASVTLITMAYYLAITIKARKEEFNHLGLLIIDSPRKNLGAKASEEGFKDEEIFNSIVRCLIKVGKDYEESIQLIVVNNGYPAFLDKINIIKEFDGDGTKGLPYGLIDDIKN
ncbi:AAA family ATPase [Clostridium ljungdahlii]|uniref:Nuclease SbcCD subunit C n=1 Tax=Clostridium ljungdahlii TaxID=1538 RepID=A0A168PI60_9CLOT|nr:AAA family ATPase [Clostridium ljungdahlii]OAA87777.1 chromosome segregation protein [Clostridium ljungdahlii]